MDRARMFQRMAELPTADVLIAAAKTALDVTSDHDLALRLFARYGITTNQSSISRYRRNLVDSGPPFDMTIALLDAAGWLNAEAVQAAGLAEAAELAQATAEEAERRAEHAESSPKRQRTA